MQYFPGAPLSLCFQGSAAALVFLGYLLPTVGLHLAEQRSRAAFAGLLRTAAVHEA